MTYKLIEDRAYLMPTNFGPAAGPRFDANGDPFPVPDDRENQMVFVVFATDEDQLNALLPEGLELAGPPIVNFTFVYMKNIAWLAGRGYAVLGVTTPVKFIGQQHKATGQFYLAAWENSCDAIITGREQLGINKIPAELPDPTEENGVLTCEARWDGHTFCRLQLSEMQASQMPELPPPEEGFISGTITRRYIPSVEDMTKAQIDELVIAPSGGLELKPRDSRSGAAELTLHETSWTQMPTQFHIVEGLRALPLGFILAGGTFYTKGAGDLREQIVLR